jgi:type II secretory pathway component PulF
MKYDEFSFLNLQLADMLRDGIPLEGAIRQAVHAMERGPLRAEFEKIEADLAAGVPLGQALAARKLPPFYVRMVQVGAHSGDFPAVLTLLADYYQRANLVWTRLKGLMTYPLILFGFSVLLSLWFAFLYSHVEEVMFRPFDEIHRGFGARVPGPSPMLQHFWIMFNLWVPPAIFGVVFGVLAAIWLTPALRRRLRWRLPAYREASLAQFAAAMHLLLKGGSTLRDALALMGSLEAGSPAGRDVERWQQRCAEGRTKFQDIAAGSRVFPPLFTWLVSGIGEDLATGFKHAADVFQARATARTELLLYSALPASLIFIGALIAAQVYPFINSIFWKFLPFFKMSEIVVSK